MLDARTGEVHVVDWQRERGVRRLGRGGGGVEESGDEADGGAEERTEAKDEKEEEGGGGVGADVLGRGDRRRA